MTHDMKNKFREKVSLIGEPLIETQMNRILDGIPTKR